VPHRRIHEEQFAFENELFELLGQFDDELAQAREKGFRAECIGRIAWESFDLKVMTATSGREEHEDVWVRYAQNPPPSQPYVARRSFPDFVD
jgi:acyl-CoA thioesterase